MNLVFRFAQAIAKSRGKFRIEDFCLVGMLLHILPDLPTQHN